LFFFATGYAFWCNKDFQNAVVQEIAVGLNGFVSTTACRFRAVVIVNVGTIDVLATVVAPHVVPLPTQHRSLSHAINSHPTKITVLQVILQNPVAIRFNMHFETKSRPYNQ